METKSELAFLELIASLFGWIWIGASIVTRRGIVLLAVCLPGWLKQDGYAHPENTPDYCLVKQLQDQHAPS